MTEFFGYSIDKLGEKLYNMKTKIKFLSRSCEYGTEKL